MIRFALGGPVLSVLGQMYDMNERNNAERLAKEKEEAARKRRAAKRRKAKRAK